MQTTGNTNGTAITLPNLRAATSFSGWSSPPWDFGTTSQLPTLQNLPLCPSRLPSDISCRWSTPHSTTGTPTPPANTQDTDDDGIPDNSDNCPTTPNHDQANNYGTDNEGDACDDTDGDTHLDINDAFPRNATEHQDSDGDRIGDNRDTDDDNDGILDTNDAATCRTIPNAHDPDAPYCQDITSAADLSNHLTADADGYYRLTKNITINTDWTPIANFRGTFNGDDHTITFSTAQPNPPLFDTINSTATVINIGILNSTLAYTNNGSIHHSYATGDSSNNSYSGGLVGQNAGTITNSYATGDSTCTDNFCDSGGLVGDNTGTIHNSYATGNSSGANSGGLVGYNFDTITNSYATGSSRGRSYSGGLVGINGLGSSINNSYATGNNTCTEYGCYSGGLVSYNSGTITNSYAIGNSSGNTNGGLVGSNLYGRITSSYRVQTTGTNLGTAITLSNLRAAASFSGWSSPPWHFGTSSQLPRHHNRTGIPLCLGATSDSDTSCRW